MSALIDLTNMKFGKLTVINRTKDRIYKNGRIRPQWLCKCECGKEVVVPTEYLRRGRTQSCGCLQKERTAVSHKKYNDFDLSGEYGVGYTAKGEPFYFDKEDFDKIKDYCWGISDDGYVYSVINGKYVRFHRLILEMNNDRNVVDHINHITNDNRKINLRVCTQSENSKNRKPNKSSKSGYNGVTWNKQSTKWIANIKANGKYQYLGSFDSVEQAIKVRQQAEEKYYGEYAYKSNKIDNLITELYGADE